MKDVASKKRNYEENRRGYLSLNSTQSDVAVLGFLAYILNINTQVRRRWNRKLGKSTKHIKYKEDLVGQVVEDV